MCASYGLGGGRGPLPDGLEPMTLSLGQEPLSDWARLHEGKAAITGRKARNLNPLIHAFNGHRELALGWWWLWLDGDGPVKFSAFNSRDDKLLRSWRAPFQRRAILPATWFVEKGVRFELESDEPFGIAAVTSKVVENATGEPLLSYSMVTRGAVGEAASVHDRMPLVLPRELYEDWLDPARPGDAGLVAEAQHASGEISRAMRRSRVPFVPADHADAGGSGGGARESGAAVGPDETRQNSGEGGHADPLHPTLF